MIEFTEEQLEIRAELGLPAEVGHYPFVNECSACLEDFASVEAFDAHRVGSMDDRQCIRRLEEAGFVKDKRDRWTTSGEARREAKRGR